MKGDAIMISEDKRLSLMISKDLYIFLRRMSGFNTQSMSEFVKKILTEYMENNSNAYCKVMSLHDTINNHSI